MKLIGLIGHENSGKTTTMELVYETLVKESEVLEAKKQEGANPHDFSCILLYKGKKVAVYSMGDYVKTTVTAIKDYGEKQCDVLVCAVRDKIFDSFSVKKKIFEHNPTIIMKSNNAGGENFSNEYDFGKIYDTLLRHCVQVGAIKENITFGMSADEVEEAISSDIDLLDMMWPNYKHTGSYETIYIENNPFKVVRCVDGSFDLEWWIPMYCKQTQLAKIERMENLVKKSLQRVYEKRNDEIPS